MSYRREAITDVLTLDEFRSLLRTAASIDDRVKSITIFYLLTILGRGGLRIGEAIHLTYDWLDEQRRMVVIPAFEDCSCGLCAHYARQLVRNADDDLTFDQAFDQYWSPKDESSRHVPIETDRDWQAIVRFLEDVPFEDLPYSTA